MMKVHESSPTHSSTPWAEKRAEIKLIKLCRARNSIASMRTRISNWQTVKKRSVEAGKSEQKIGKEH